jgi:hypothetical protein
VTADDNSKIYGEADPSLTYHISSGSLTADDAFTGAVARLAGEDVGTYDIQQGTLTLNSNYNFSFVEGTFTIGPNQIPNQPGNVSPINGTTGLSLTPTLQASDFSDPNAGDSHEASQWQITGISGDYASPIFDSGTDSLNLVSILIPSGRLAYSTSYYWHVRHQDDHGDWSSWSAETSFVTMSAPAAENTGVSISTPTAPINSGEQFIISIVVVPGTAIAGMQFDLHFDPSLVTVDKVEEGDLLVQDGANTFFNSGYIDNQLGIVRGAFGAIISPGKTVSKNGIFATVTLTARKGSASCPISLFNVIVGDMAGNAVPVSLGSVSAPEIVDANAVPVSPGNESAPEITEARPSFRLWVLSVIVGAAAVLIAATIAVVLFRRRQMVRALQASDDLQPKMRNK